MTPKPLLILSDAPTAGTGLGRITRDLATRIHANLGDVFRVGTAGYAGAYSRTLDFPQYSIEMHEWVVFNLPDIWYDFAGGEKGIILTIWDASRLLWLSRPENVQDPRLRKFLTPRPFELWGYLPIDASGPLDKLTTQLRHVVEGYDRVLAYSKWAEGILRRTLEGPILDTLDNRPHGIDTSVFYPRNRAAARHGLGERIQARNPRGKFISIPDDSFMVGIVATNQVRKDWGLGIQVVAELLEHRNVFIWIHTDVVERHWSIASLLYDFGVRDNNMITGTVMPFTDDAMAWLYSACDVTLGIGNGEGWGFPLAESLACGTPVIHGNYGGGSDFVPKEYLVDPICFRLEGAYNCVRAMYRVEDWVVKVNSVAGQRAKCPEYIKWDNAWKGWEEWFRKGIRTSPSNG